MMKSIILSVSLALACAGIDMGDDFMLTIGDGQHEVTYMVLFQFPQEAVP